MSDAVSSCWIQGALDNWGTSSKEEPLEVSFVQACQLGMLTTAIYLGPGGLGVLHVTQRDVENEETRSVFFATRESLKALAAKCEEAIRELDSWEADLKALRQAGRDAD